MWGGIRRTTPASRTNEAPNTRLLIVTEPALRVAHRKRVNGPIARVFSSTRAGAGSPVGDGGGAEGMSGTSRTAQDEERGRPAPGESRAQPRDNGEREWRCQDALIVAGKRLVPEALQGAEIVAVGQPLELGPLVSD
jgi:hypothetical protein